MSNHRLEDSLQLVTILLGQYQQYLTTSQSIEKLKKAQMSSTIALANKSGTSLTAILQNKPPEIIKIEQEIKEAEHRLHTISDEMTFANPVVWMAYKFKAYAGTSQAINDMEDFRKHCRPAGYICTKRYHFLKEYLLVNSNTDLNDSAHYPADMQLDQVYGRDEFVALVNDQAFMSQWEKYEYYKQNHRVAKWENYLSNSEVV